MEAFPIPDLEFFDVVEWIITIFWTLDIPITFRTGYMDGSKVEMRPVRIAVNYCKTWFVPDLMIVGMEWAGRLLTAFIEGGALTRITRIFRAFRSVRLLRLTKLQALLHTIEDQVNSPAIQLTFALTKMATLLVIIMHFITCFWFWIGDTTKGGWVGYANIPACERHFLTEDRGPIPEDDSVAIKEWVMWYFFSARWVTAQANGRVDQDPRRNMVEMGFTCVASVMLPMVCMAVFVSKITATMMELNTMAQSRRATRLQLNQYLSGHSISATLTSRLKAHLRGHKDLDKQQEQEKFVLSILPKQLQNDLLYEVRAPPLVAHRFFDAINMSFPQAVKHVTRQALRPVLTHQEETIFETGDACNRMIFAYRGRFIYSQNDKETHDKIVRQAEHDGELPAAKEVPIPTAGEASMGLESAGFTAVLAGQEVSTGVWLSEAALWLEWQNQGMFTALTDGLFFALEVESFDTVVSSYIDVIALVVAYALQFEISLKNQSWLSDIIDMEFESRFIRDKKSFRRTAK